MSSGFLKSITNSFKSNNDKFDIQVESITNDKYKQDLFIQVRSSPLNTRLKSINEIINVLNEFDSSVVPKVWYVAKDLISPNNQSNTRQSGLNLLSSCIELGQDQQQDDDTMFAYFNDLISNCFISKDKLDPLFPQFLEIIDKITTNGKFIHHYQNSFKLPIIQFFNNLLSSNELNKSLKVLNLLNFINECIKYELFTSREDELHGFLTNLIKLCLKTSNFDILESCLYIIDSINLYNNIPLELLYEILSIIMSSSNLNLKFNDIVLEITNNLINKLGFQEVFNNLLDIIISKNSNEKNINASIGTIKILGQLTINFASLIHFQSILLNFKKIINWNKSNLSLTILQFINEIYLNDLVLNQINFNTWDDPKSINILEILNILSTKITKNDEIDCFKLILIHLQNLMENSKYPGKHENLIKFFITHSNKISNKISITVLKFYQLENYCSPIINPDSWEQNLNLILENFYYDQGKDLNVRLYSLKLIKDIYDSIETTTPGNNEIFTRLNEFFLKNLYIEENSQILDKISEILIQLSLFLPREIFEQIINNYILPGFIDFQKQRRSSITTFTTTRSPQLNKNTQKKLTKTLVTIFSINLVNQNHENVLNIYNTLIKIIENSLVQKNIDLLLIISRLFVRIRASTDKQIYLSNPTDMDGLSAAFQRNLNIKKQQQHEEDLIDSLTLENLEKWTYPEEVSYIPNETLDKPCINLTILDDNSIDPNKSSLNIESWLNVIIKILETCPDWEIYSFIYAHFCPQLSNLKLFESCSKSLIIFKNLICNQLILKNLPSNLKLPPKMTKYDLQVAIVRNFTPLISYHGLFSKQDEDQLINSLLVGLSSWEKTAIPCIHILTVCCYEIPLSIKKYLPMILTKLQTRISSAFASAHILEFLLSLSYLPELTSNFTVDEFKRAFGITFKLIQYAHEIQELKNSTQDQHQGILQHGKELKAEISPSTENLEVTPTISIYLLTLSYDVIANWYLNMKLNDRKYLSSFIIKNLITSTINHGSDINNQNLGFLDLISRFTYSDLELKFNPIPIKTLENNDDDDEPILSSKWVYGSSIISIDTHPKTGESIIITRRASGTTVFKIIPEESMIPVYTNQLHSKPLEDGTGDFSSNFIFLQLIIHSDPENSNKPIAIPDNEPSLIRSITNFDRIPVVEFHKIGLLYIGPNQKTENEILSNTSGSLKYDKFLSKFGRLIKLKNCKSFYVGGLDIDNNNDGEYAYGWNDKILQLIYHTTTLMPNRTNDEQFLNKKRHIGNNYVNIFFDESGLQFDFNIIKSQFNFLNIVIQPHSVSFHGNSSNDKIQKYKVKIHRRSGVPGLFATCHFKIVSEENLSTFVRTLSLVANQFAQIWHSNGQYTSNWSHRMKQINMIKEKSLNIHQQQQDSKTNEEKIDKTTGQSFLDQLSGSTSGSSTGLSRNNSISRSKFESLQDGDNEIFRNLEFNSFTK
ncbi:Tuberous sclerosis 2 protein [Wickerhamomyces ciferrii]|uniref:Tuberous sclerosis 2 protein n=1 Tax=Wickerhamomyces ciferrii (strain ATCC 14091 / BCRC 22168 / CBS 111 / JCM 3599 / NBRC 0793 / NRRL Y-1031 F-60-10) TaxID=1206466 RepID=K0KJ16_WICCF|nr:Tuberous sclerosis 2 protein [Wickerhamomyces ciferrii]CCH41459.1 Tuberous sclerosis 2 protein [Wickerhamomyces ciferrii]